MAVTEADNPFNSARPVHGVSISGSLALNPTTFDWKEADKYKDLCNFETEVIHFNSNSYNIQKSERV